MIIPSCPCTAVLTPKTPPDETDNLAEIKTFITFILSLKPGYNYDFISTEGDVLFPVFCFPIPPFLLISEKKKKKCLWSLIENKQFVPNSLQQSAVSERLHQWAKHSAPGAERRGGKTLMDGWKDTWGMGDDEWSSGKQLGTNDIEEEMSERWRRNK